MERFLTTVQLGFAICLLVLAIGSATRCIITGVDILYALCFAAMTATAWFLMVKPAWEDFKEARANKKGDKQ